MAPDSGARLTGVWFLASFTWLLYSMQRHSLISQPRLSSFLLLFISGISALFVSLFSKWLPGADGRFDSDAVLKASLSSLPPRPRRFYVPCIIALVLFRLEITFRSLHDFQCSSAGVEAFLPLVLAAYRFFSYRPPQVESDEPEEMWGSVLEDLRNWFLGSPFTLLLGTSLLSYGAFSAGNSTIRSTYFCSSLADQGSLVAFIQWIGLFADAAIIILSWRVLSWARTTRSRLRTLGGILLATSFATCIPSLATRLFQRNEIAGHQSLGGVNPLYIFDTLSTGIVIATLVISASLMLCDTSPLEPVAIATAASGLLAGIRNTLLVGTYQQISSTQPLLVLGAISLGFTVFTYAIDMRSVIFIRRVFFLVLLLSILIFSAIYATLTQKMFTRHPVDDLVYKNRIEADRWLRHATVSTTLKLAVAEYGERHHGRNPPRNFDKWFEFAQEKKSVVIDKFDQIERDILPFWGLRPQTIRDGLEFLKSQPNIGIIRIVDGKVSSNSLAEPPQQEALDEIVNLISAFVNYLPAMEIAINLQERPRVMVPWNEIHQLRTIATQAGFQFISGRLGKREDSDSSVKEKIHSTEHRAPKDLVKPYITAHQFRQLEALTCPPGSPTRSGVSWDVRDFCASCASPHSKEQFLNDWQMALDPCHQPDIFNLHEFHTTPHQYELHQSLLPLFSGSKTASFNDILIPFSWGGSKEYYDGTSFSQKRDLLLWQGDVKDIPKVNHELLHGSHRLRLVHLVRNATAPDRTPMLLGIGTDKDSRFRYEHVPTTEGNSILPLQFSLTGPPEGCEDAHCEFMRDEFGLEPPAAEVDSRYVMLLDTVDGPPANLMQVLRSNSVPVLSSIFQQWFTERLMPWVHFIPVDVRYHALHSTMSYFVGLDGRGALNGRKQITPARTEDAKWISQQGRKWAEQAMRKEDMEVYLFRLLLEWGRVIDDNRDEIGFVFKG
ncbi:putative capsular associated protein [Rosellinia necatrix]|uniref:Putative capsular associated protein n=1 Tax=Rosellinia necatrix TaxID=77044 RepID=A0A1S7ULX0_ROSNE|nr:putative capsular associated protein [Rosellinia necatrix]